MEVILLEKIRNLGNIGETVAVKAGFGRNYLLPQGKALPATAANLAEVETKRAELEKRQQEILQAAQKRANEIDAKTVTIAARAGSEGKLFGSIGAREIAKAISEQFIAVEKSEIDLPGDVIRSIGEYEAFVQLHSEVSVKIMIHIVEDN